MRLLAVLFCLSTGMTVAQDLPARYDVADVAAGDVLNIRAAPDANAAVVGKLTPDAINIEVIMLSPDGKWGMVGIPEGNGWAATRYLTASNQGHNSGVPRPMACGGTEPFWTLNLGVRGDEYQMMGDDSRDVNATEETVADNGFLIRLDDGPTLERTLIVQRLQCSDGMSDRRYGWAATLFNASSDGNQVLTGCCTLDAR